VGLKGFAGAVFYWDWFQKVPFGTDPHLDFGCGCKVFLTMLLIIKYFSVVRIFLGGGQNAS